MVFLTAKLLDFILGALLGALFFATARLLGYSRGVSLTLTLLLTFGTALWPDVLSGEEHTMEGLFVLAAAYAALRYTVARRKSPLWVAVMGVAAGLVFVTRIAGFIAIPIFAIYLLVLDRRWHPGNWKRPFLRHGAIYAAGVLPSIIVNAAFDAIRFGSPLHTGPNPDHSFGYPPWLGIPNLLISPGKGLIWYVPALFLLPLVVRPFWRRFPLPTILFGIICGMYLLFYANVNYWHGDPAWGPRYLYAVLPYLILPLGEMTRRWRRYRVALRGLVVGVLAASFLVQFSSATVSYWRHWNYIYAYHLDQVENHNWGQNLNYWWSLQQSPVVISLAGIYDVTQKYASHAPLLQHAADQRLSNPYESCVFQVFGQAAICLTALDDLNVGGNWNTFTVWWAHTYPWWSHNVVIVLALGLLTLFLASGGALLVLFAGPAWPWRRRARSPAAAYGDGSVAPGSANGPGSNGHGHDAAIDLDALPELTPARPLVSTSSGGGTMVAEIAAPPRVVKPAPPRVAHGVAALVPLGLALPLAALAYGTIMGAALVRAPRTAAPLIHTAPRGAIVRDGSSAYQVLRVTGVRALPGGVAAPAIGHHYVIVTLRLYNPLDRPNSVTQQFFALTDSSGLAYPWVNNAARQVAELYHLMPFGSLIPARGTLDGAIVYLVRDGASHLELLGPGITLMRLTQ